MTLFDIFSYCEFYKALSSFVAVYLPRLTCHVSKDILVNCSNDVLLLPLMHVKLRLVSRLPLFLLTFVQSFGQDMFCYLTMSISNVTKPFTWFGGCGLQSLVSIAIMDYAYKDVCKEGKDGFLVLQHQ